MDADLTNLPDGAMLSVFCIDPMFGDSNDGSYLTIDDAVAHSRASKRRCPSRSRYEVHVNKLGYSVRSGAVLSLLV